MKPRSARHPRHTRHTRHTRKPRLPRNIFWTLWAAPVTLGVLTASGLATALISDAWGDWWAWLALGLPVAVMAWYAWPRGTTSAAPAQDSDSDSSISAAISNPATPAAGLHTGS